MGQVNDMLYRLVMTFLRFGTVCGHTKQHRMLLDSVLHVYPMCESANPFRHSWVGKYHTALSCPELPAFMAGVQHHQKSSRRLKQAVVQALYSHLMQFLIWSGDLSSAHMRHIYRWRWVLIYTVLQALAIVKHSLPSSPAQLDVEHADAGYAGGHAAMAGVCH